MTAPPPWPCSSPSHSFLQMLLPALRGFRHRNCGQPTCTVVASSDPRLVVCLRPLGSGTVFSSRIRHVFPDFNGIRAADAMASSRMPSFLRKIGSDNTATLHIPSSFIKSYVMRLGASLTLEGPSAGKWTVAAEGSFSKCNVGLGHGWMNFLKDHHLQPGDQLLFTLTEDSYFLVEVYDESGCQKLSALDAVNSATALDSNGADDTNDMVPEFETKALVQQQEGDKRSKGDVGGSSTAAKKPDGHKQKKSSSEPAKASPAKAATISLSDSEEDTPSSSVGKQAQEGEKLRTNGKRGRPKKAQDFYQDIDEDDFSLFHKPRARNTPKRTAAELGGEAVKKLSLSAAKKKAIQEEIVLPPKPKGFDRHDKVGHGYMRCHFIIDGSLEDPLHALEAS